MTEQSHPGESWATRLSPTMRGIGIAASGLFLIFFAGAIAGFITAMVETGGPHKPLAWAALAVFVAAFGGSALLLLKLIRSFKMAPLSAFDRRYYRMWGLVILLSLPIGVGLAFLDGSGPALGKVPDLFADTPISPRTALIFSVLLLLALAAAAILYHRTIDDHEERAYLWGSTVAFYFLAAALPVAWLLGRGGLLTQPGMGTALVLMLASFIIQSLVWMWFKFR